MPVKSVPSTVVVPRSSAVIEKRMQVTELAKVEKVVAYANFQSMCKSAQLIKAAGWNLSEFPDYVLLSKCDDKHSVPKFELYIDDGLDLLFVYLDGYSQRLTSYIRITYDQ